MFGLYYYRARGASNGIYIDASCRQDPNLDQLTLGICRPALRKRLFRDEGPLTLIFYTRQRSLEDTLLLTALLELKEKLPNHLAAAKQLAQRLPSNVLTPGNPCECGTVFLPGMKDFQPHDPRCGCPHYVGRDTTPYLIFQRSSARLALSNPIQLPFEELKKLAPQFFHTQPQRKTWSAFQKATENIIHEIENRSEQDALRRLFQEPGGAGSEANAPPSDCAPRKRC